MARLTLFTELVTKGAVAFKIRFVYDLNGSPSSVTYLLARSNYNATYSMLRVEWDGNLRVYTYEENVDRGAWDVAFTLFDSETAIESKCALPKRCGALGVCEDEQCVACLTAMGLLG